MYKKLAFIMLAGGVFTSAGNAVETAAGNGDWAEDCERNYSETSRAYNDCKARREMQAKAAAAGANASGVALQPEKLNTTTQRTDEGRASVSDSGSDGQP